MESNIKTLEERLHKLSRELPKQVRDRYDNELNTNTKQFFLCWYFGSEKYTKHINLLK